MTIKDRVYTALFAVFSFLVFLPQYTSAKIIAWLDTAYYFLPFRMLTGELVKKCVIPLWNPYIYCGNPLLANMQSAVFYPMSVFFYVFSPVFAVKAITFITFFMAAFFFYSFLRLYKLSEEGSFLGGFLFAFTVYMTVKAVEMADLHTMIWAPAILYFVKKNAAGGRNFDLALMAITLMMSFLGGHLQVFSYVYILFAAFYFFENISAGNKNIFGRFAAVNAALLAVVFIQALPTLEFIFNSRRVLPGGMGYETYMGGFAGFEQIAQMFFPFLDQYVSNMAAFLNWMGLIEIGILALFLSGLAAVKMEGNRYRLFLGCVFAVAFVCSFMSCLPFFEFIYNHVFFMKLIRYAGKINFIYFFVMCVFAAYGFEMLFDAGKKTTKVFGLLAVGFWAAVFAAYLFADLGRYAILKFYKQKFVPLISLDNFVDLSMKYDFFVKHFLVYLMMLSCAVFLIYLVNIRGIKNTIMKYIFLAATILCSVVYHWGAFNYYGELKDIAGRSKTIDFLLKDRDIIRTRILAPAAVNALEQKPNADSVAAALYYQRDSLIPNIPMARHIYNADGFDSLALANFFELRGVLNKFDMPWENPAFPLLNAKYIASIPKLRGKFLKLECSGLTNVYEFKKPSGPAFFIPSAREGSMLFLKTNRQVLDTVTGAPFDLYREAVFHRKDYEYLHGLMPPHTDERAAAGRASIDFAWENTNEIHIGTVTGSDGMLVVSEAYCPGWKAYVDGSETKIVEADGVFKSVYIKAGKHSIIFKYMPYSFAAGAVVSILSMLLLFSGAFLKFARNPAQSDGSNA